MAAYAALISLSDTIDRLLNHSRISISLEQNQQLLSLLEHANSFVAFLDRFPDKFNSLEGRMRDLAHEAEDIIEYVMLDQLSSCPEFQTKVINPSKEYEGGADSHAALATSSTAPPVRKDSMGGWFQRFIHPLRRNNKQKEHADSVIRKDVMVGFQDCVLDLKESLIGEQSSLQVILICGRAGIGKTTLARYLYHHPLIMERFEIRIWVNVSEYVSGRGIVSRILESLEGYTKYVKGRSYAKNEEKKVYKILSYRRYLIVMDGIRNQHTWNHVTRVFPQQFNGSRVMLTSTSCVVAYDSGLAIKKYEMRLLDADESWNLLKQNVFKDEDCPPELEDVGKDIARRCKGLPLTVVTIAGILSTTTRTCASWRAWAEELNLEKVMKEIGLIAREVREIRDSSSSNNDVQRGADSSAALNSLSLADSIINNSNTVHLNAAASSSGKVMSMKKNNIKEDMVQLGDSNSSSNGVQLVVASSSTLSSSSTAPTICKDYTVGFEDYLIDLKDRLCGEPSKKLQVIPICGMGGIGKTTLARNLYYDPLIMNHFDIHVWVTISQDFSAQRILSSLVESIKEFDKGGLGHNDDEKVHKILFRRRYLVVMDDIWSSKAWDVVRRVFPDDSNGSRVMLTTRLFDVASYPDPSSKIYEMSLLNEDHSWNLLKQNVFGDEDCPSELQDIGRNIARSCKGLPLAIVVIAGLLSTASMNPTSWMEMAEKVKSAETEHNQIEEILSLSYVQLPQYLRPCFLYMGSFSEDEKIHVKKLIRLWIAEGFVISPVDSNNFEKVAEEFLEELVKRNLVLAAKRGRDGSIKRCSLHDLMRDLCIRKSHESKFFLNMRYSGTYEESFIEIIRNQRRVTLDSSNVEFLSSLHGSTIRSIKCSGLHLLLHPEGLDFLENVRLLRVLVGEHLYVEDFLTLVHLDELFHLRYLAIRSLGGFPLSLLRLQNLQTLVILDQYSRSSLELKWCMSQLRHVHYGGTIEFEDPKETDYPLESLQTLSYVSHSTCRETILKMIPNLKKLGIKCSNGLPSDGGVLLDGLEHLHRLEDLEIYAGDEVKYYRVTFPRMLKKLILRCWERPWNDIIVFSSLPNLQVLELIDCSCVGGTWETTEGEFPVLEVLKISRLSFKNWVTESSHFPMLKLLQLHFCYDLSGISNDIGEIPTLELIEVKGRARKSLIKSVELIREEQEDMGNDTLQVVCTAEPNDDD